jgi:hypothetical protein
MSLRFRLAVLMTAGIITAGYTASLVFDPLCAVFRSRRHYAHKPAAHAATAAVPASLADHR